MPESLTAPGPSDLSPTLAGEADAADGVSPGRQSLSPGVEGDLVANGAGQMLSASTPVQGAVGGVAIERAGGTPPDPVPRVGVGVVLQRDGRVLLGLRLGAHGAGTWALPGGHLEFGETPADCARRELLEETGLVLGVVRPGPWTNDVMPADGRHYLTVLMHGELARAPAPTPAGGGAAPSPGAVGFPAAGHPNPEPQVPAPQVPEPQVLEPQVLEPHKCGGWRWCDWDDLPQPLFAPLASLVARGWRPDSGALWPEATRAPGRVVALARDGAHRFSKTLVPEFDLIAGLGVAGDSHAGALVQHRSRVARNPNQPNLRQVHLLQAELLDELAGQGLAVAPGQLGENICTRGLDLLALPTGTLLQVGASAVLELTGLRNPCAQIEAFQPGLLAAVLGRTADGALVRKAGVMAVVRAGGPVHAGDAVSVSVPAGPPHSLRPLQPV